MTIRLTSFVLLSLFVFSQNLWAENAVEDERARIEEVFPDSCHFSGHFSQRRKIDGLPVPLMSDGDFFFSCDLGLVWSTLSPFKEAILYATASRSYRVNDEGNVQELRGLAQSMMSKVLLRLLRGDAEYFSEEFVITTGDDSELELVPESYFMKKGIEKIRFKKRMSAENGVSLEIAIVDVTGKSTEVKIDRVSEYQIDGKSDAVNKCEELYPDSSNWCTVLSTPRRSKKL